MFIVGLMYVSLSVFTLTRASDVSATMLHGPGEEPAATHVRGGLRGDLRSASATGGRRVTGSSKHRRLRVGPHHTAHSSSLTAGGRSFRGCFRSGRGIGMALAFTPLS